MRKILWMVVMAVLGALIALYLWIWIAQEFLGDDH
jgi:hypothetical protein